jgi:argininosuccinate lyase
MNPNLPSTSQTLWGQSQTQSPAGELFAFTAVDDKQYDLRLAPYDVQGSVAHVRMLAHTGLITADEARQLEAGLQAIAEEIAQGRFQIEPEVEDVHSQVELLLTRRLGEVGKKLHTARSRNDQVLVDLRLFMRHRTAQLAELVAQVAQAFLYQARLHQGLLLPGHTHFQLAMPSSFGLWYGAWAESLADDLVHLQGIWQLLQRNPLGSAAGYGSSFPIHREHTTQTLGFQGLNVSSVYAQLTRGKLEKLLLAATAEIATTLGRFAADVCLFLNAELGYLKLDPAFTTGSSLMPQKQNPDGFELLRARCNQLKSMPNQIQLLMSNLPSGYHRDMQLTKATLFQGLDELEQCLRFTLHSLPFLHPQENLLAQPRYAPLFAVEAVNAKVQQGMPFRDAYREVAAAIQSGQFAAQGRMPTRHTGSIENPGLDMIQTYLETAAQPFRGFANK